MALEPKFTIDLSQDGKTIVFKETTGVYSLSNPGGYGTPNPAAGSVTVFNLTVTYPSGTVTVIDMIPEGYPDITGLVEYEIVSDTPFADGVYKFSTEVATPSLRATDYELFKAFYYNIHCCVAKKVAAAKIPDCGCDCATEYLEDISNLWVLFKGMQANARNGNMDAFNELLSEVTKMCNLNDCKC